MNSPTAAGSPSASPSAPPAALGRGVIITAGAEVPGHWKDVARVFIDDAVVRSPAKIVDELHRAWVARIPVVVELAVDPAVFREPRSFNVEPWEAGARFEPLHDRLHFLVWANNVDARSSGTLSTSPNNGGVWWWARKAERLGAKPCTDGSGDVVLEDGRPVWIDGGPRGPLPPEVGLVVHRESVDLNRLTIVPPAVQPTTDLAPDQLSAVAHGSGPARIIAPAGSGKTRVLTERLRLLHRSRAYERETTIAVAYNVKARAEMEQRCEDFKPRVRTLNAYGQALLNDALGRLTVLNERDVRGIMQDLVEIPVSRRRSNTDPLAPYIEALSLARLGLIDPENVEAQRDDVPGFAGVFPRYRAHLKERGLLDFDEQIYRTIEVLLSNGQFRQEAQRGCRHLLVDEFQDLTPAHVLMLRLLSLPTLDCFGVGDDDQVIYGHAGADPQFLLEFDQLFPGSAAYALEVNYRSAEPIVTAARTLLGYNNRRIVKEIRATTEASTDKRALVVVKVDTEQLTRQLVDHVQGWMAAGTEPKDIAILTRVNAQLLAPQVALAQFGVPIIGALDERVLERTGLRAALAYLRISVSGAGAASADIAEILRRPSRGLPQWFPERLRRKKAWSMNELRSIGTTMTDRESEKLERLIADLETVRRVAKSGTTARVLRAVRDDVGLDSAMELLDKSSGSEGSSHLDDLDALLQVAALEPDPVKFETWLRMWLVRKPEDVAGHEAPTGLTNAVTNAVTLATVHKVKGLEWDSVLVFGANAGVFPHRLSEDEEEERRVLHVAITRGRHQVAIFADSTRPSFMIGELDGSAPVRVRTANIAPGTRVPPGATSTAGAAKDSGKDTGKDSVAPGDEPLFEALRTWRTARAKADKVPPYIVLSDQTLRAICSKKPTSLVQMTRVPGIGPTKLENYGEELLEVLSGFTREING
jgi:DNA helicase II / ATP-dependent DNA helicase PcrA